MSVDTATHDLLGTERPHRKIHQHGFIELVDMMPRVVPVGRTADSAIVQAARTSTGQGLKTPEEDRGLIRYLLRHRHTTPFEMVEFKFNVSLPIFIARQWIRHRTANVNEVSARYTVLPDQYYLPGEWRRQSKSNRQGGEEPMEYEPWADEVNCDRKLHQVEDMSFMEYHRRVRAGVSRELARSCLPVSAYTQWYWKCDLHNILHFLSLRCDPHAQLEIRDYADAMLALIEPFVPVTIEAFRDYRLGAVTLSRLEADSLRAEIARLKLERDGYMQAVRQYEQESGRAASPFSPIHVTVPELSNKRENDEWLAKRTKLGLTN